MKNIYRQHKDNWFFIGPALFLYLFWVVLPTIRGFYYSFTNFDGLSSPRWVGLANFIALSQDTQLFLIALRNNFILMIIPAFLIITISLLFAFLLHQDIYGKTVFRIIFYLPNTISIVAVSLLFMLLYSPSSFGILNGILKYFGNQEPIAFTISKNVVWAAIPVILWGAIGFNTLLYLAAMERIPKTFYEAIIMDGGKTRHIFWHITIPFIWEILVISFIFLIIGGLRIFDPIWLLAGQVYNPDSATIAVMMYNSIISEYRVGYGTAIGIILFLTTIIAVLLMRFFTKRESLEY